MSRTGKAEREALSEPLCRVHTDAGMLVVAAQPGTPDPTGRHGRWLPRLRSGARYPPIAIIPAAVQTRWQPRTTGQWRCRPAITGQSVRARHWWRRRQRDQRIRCEALRAGQMIAIIPAGRPDQVAGRTTGLWRCRPAIIDQSVRARPPDYDDSSPRRDHQASAAVIALSASRMPSPTSPAVAAQCKGIRARAPGSQRCSSRVSGSGAVPS